MPVLPIEGVPVDFPFEPYACQVDFMRCMLKCLQNGDNGILESPTGTGKTLCLLCSSLAWLETKKAQIQSKRWQMAQSLQSDAGTGAVDFYEEYTTKLAEDLDSGSGKWSGELGAPKIIYSSRTHSQLSQAMNELKRTSYKHFKAGVLGSREQLCIHPQVMKEENNSTKVHLCRAKVQARSCFFYNNVENFKAGVSQGVMDIEDIVAFGEKQKCCPYYLSREMKKDLDIIFMPYNYLLDPKSRKAHGVELQGNIVIFDEAHNVERICEDSTSCDLSSTDIAGAIRDINELSAKLMDMIGEDEGADLDIAGDINLKEVLELKAMLCHIEESLDSIQIPKPDEGLTKPGSYIFEIFKTANLSFSSKTQIISLIDKIVSFLTNEGAVSFHSKGSCLSKFGDVLKIVFNREPDPEVALSYHEKVISKHFKVHIAVEQKKYKSKTVDSWSNTGSSKLEKQGRVLSYWCFSPGHAMDELKAQGIKCIILTSGTLSPMSSFSAEMGIEFPVQLENPHVIQKHQVMVGILGRGPDNTLLSSTYENRSRNDYQSSLGNTIVNFAKIVPNGLLLFFPSYIVMEKCLDNWRNSNIWNRIEQYKPMFVEPKRKPDFQTAMLNFYEKVNDPKLNGAIFAAVCRGKVSEGLDFTDANGRAVIITGLPYPPRMDPKVKLKMLYLDESKIKNPKGLSSQEWYKQQATRAVNQAIGRVIRHRQDYGAIVLCDNRFSNSDMKAQLPSWVRPHTKTYANFGHVLRDLSIFFKTAEKTLPSPQASATRKIISGGCEGAHFVPTISRTGTVYKPSACSKIEQHVPSMRPSKQQDMPFSKMKIQYEGHKEKSESRGSLLDCLSKEVSNTRETPSQLDFYNSVPSTSTQNIDRSKRKKILIKSDSQSVSKAALETAEAYIAQVKKTLSKDGYKTFAQMLGDYKKSGDFSAMIPILASLFTDSSDNFPLFRMFYKFLRSAHKEQFDKVCLEVTGQLFSQDSNNTSKKRPLNNTEDEPTEKRNKLNSYKIPLKSSNTVKIGSDDKKMTSSEEKQKLDLAFKDLECNKSASPVHTKYDKTSQSSADNLKPGLESTEKYIAQVKKVLSKDEYKHFFKMLSDYKKGGDFSAMISILAGLFTDTSDNLHLFRKFYKFVLSKHKAEFDKVCIEITGTSCTEGFSSSCKRTSFDSSKIENSEDQNKKGNEQFSQSSDTAKIATQTSKTGEDDRCSVTCEEETHHEVLKDVGNSITKSDVHSKNEVVSEYDPDNLNKHGIPKQYLQSMGFTCASCDQDAHVPLRAPCLHVCCLNCWRDCMQKDKQCPVCHAPVKRKHLSKICFPCGPNA